jgi:hypothetical protein
MWFVSYDKSIRITFVQFKKIKTATVRELVRILTHDNLFFFISQHRQFDLYLGKTAHTVSWIVPSRFELNLCEIILGQDVWPLLCTLLEKGKQEYVRKMMY